MESRRFDAISRVFGRNATRRTGLAASIGAALGIRSGADAADPADPAAEGGEAGKTARTRLRCTPVAGPCSRNRRCCSGTCAKGRCVECRAAADCDPANEGCIAAACTCGANGGCRGENPLCCAVLGAVTPVSAPGFRLQMTELRWAPGSSSAAHSHPIAQVACVQSGALGFTLQQGTATITRGGSGSNPASTEVVPLDTEVFIGPRDCIAYDEFDVPTIHTVWNASDGETVLWMSDLVEIGPRYTSFA